MINELFPTYFPTVANDSIKRWIGDIEQMFKAPVKQVFPYPLDIKKVYSVSTGKLLKIVFEVALAGVKKEDIDVQLKKEKFLTIKVDQKEEVKPEETDEEVEYVYSARTLTHKNGEVTFKLFTDVDLEKFRQSGVKFKDGLLTVEVQMKEADEEDDVIKAEF